MKNLIAQFGVLSATLVCGVTMLAPMTALADVNTGNYGGGFEVFDNYDSSPSYYEPTYSSYYEPSYTTYYEPSYQDYYEPSYYDYYEPSYYDYYEPSYYDYYEPSYYSYQQPYYDDYSSYSPPYSSYEYSYDYVYDYYYESDYDDRDRDDDEDISCDLEVSDSSVDEGDEVTLEWEIDGDADFASINHGIGRVDEDGGEEEVEVDEDTTFRLTVRNDDGDEDTCSASVRVDEDRDFSSIDFEGEPVRNPPVVYLSSLPYTGVEDITPSMWGFILTLLGLLSLGGYYFFVKRNHATA
jgi:hypothetical protein